MPSKSLKARRNHNDPTHPLDPKAEAFCLAVCKGMKLRQAHETAGYAGKTDQAAFQLRHSPRVDARINALLRERVKADSRQFARRQKVKGDILDAAVKRLADMAFTDPREVFAWRNEPVLNADGEVIGERTKLIARDSADLSPAAASLVRGAFVKAGEVKLETHDQRSALVDLVKLLKGSDAVTNNVTVTTNTVNVGGIDAVTAAQRVAFLMAAAASRIPSNVHNSQLVDVTPKPPEKP